MAIPEIDVDELARHLSAGIPLIDVRQPEEYAEARVPGAVLIPLAEVSARVTEVPAGDVAIICRSGGRSLRAAEFLAGEGRRPMNVTGGTLAWIASGRAVDSGDTAS